MTYVSQDNWKESTSVGRTEENIQAGVFSKACINCYKYLLPRLLLKSMLKASRITDHEFIIKALGLRTPNSRSASYLCKRRFPLAQMTLHLDIAKTTPRMIFVAAFAYEYHLYQYLLAHLQPGQCFIDVGANVGYYSVLAARKVGPYGSVFAFEPDPLTQRVLQANATANHADNITIVPRALSDHCAVERLYFHPLNDGGSSLERNDTQPSFDFADVPVISFDLFWESLDSPHPVDWVKIDVEGHATKCIMGMQKTLRKYQPKLIVEVLEEGSDSRNAIVATLRSVGYTSFTFLTHADMLCTCNR